MLFTSYEFLGFMGVLLGGYYLFYGKYQWIVLLAASYLFYFSARPDYLLYILTTTITVYFVARKTDESRSRGKEIRFPWFLMCMIVNIGILGTVKYGNFMISNMNDILNLFGSTRKISFLTLALPMGISFYTFQAIGYLIDVHRGTIQAEKNILKFALFVSFFPQLVQGPINRFSDLGKTLYEPHAFNWKQVSRGFQRILWGYFKKLVIADRILAGVTTVIHDTDTYKGAYILVVMVLYTLELYADFTGGIDITIGIAETLGVKVQENFRQPYFSKSLKEYWRRWHISMCSWFRDYIFYPVSTSKCMYRFSKFCRSHWGTAGKRLPVHLASFVVWLATGIWHGANWNFVVWGLCNWLILVVSQELEPYYRRFHKNFSIGRRPGYVFFQMMRTFLLVCCLNLFDCYDSLKDTLRMIMSLFTEGNWDILWNGALMNLGLAMSDYIILILGTGLLICVSLKQQGGSVRDMIAGQNFLVKLGIWYGLFLMVVIFGVYGIGYDASQFIYNQF